MIQESQLHHPSPSPSPSPSQSQSQTINFRQQIIHDHHQDSNSKINPSASSVHDPPDPASNLNPVHHLNHHQASAMDSSNQISSSGNWVPLPNLLLGTVIHPFNPIQINLSAINNHQIKSEISSKVISSHHSQSHLSSSTLSNLISPNPHQVSLEIGDECYAFEQYLPDQSSSDSNSAWYRGYVVTLPHQPTISTSQLPAPHQPSTLSDLFNTSSLTNINHDHPSSSHLSDEPQVFLGIFPASHLQIREQLDQSTNRHSLLFNQTHPSTINQNLSLNQSRTFSKNHVPMDTLPEEDESDLITNYFKPIKSPSQSQLESNNPKVEKLTPPLPSLKASDETISGRDEPLIDEIACALREWYDLLYLHLHRRHYRLFHTTKDQIEALHMGRRQLLAQTLSTEEAAKLRRDLVNRLVYGNYLQSLDIIVRHPDYGALVDSEVDMETVDSRSWMSIIRMYVCQVKLAYFYQALNPSTNGQPNPQLEPNLLNPLSSISSNHLSKLNEPNQIPLNAHLPSLRNSKSNPSTCIIDINSSQLHHSNQPSTSPSGLGHRPKFYHIMLEVKSFLASPCVEGELIELYFSLYNKSESRFLTEEFCVILNHLGLPINSNQQTSRPKSYHEELKSVTKPSSNHPILSFRTVFKDISQHDVQDSIFLVCRVIKNGGMKSTPGQPFAIPSISTMQESSINSSNSHTYRFDSDSASNLTSFDKISQDNTIFQPYSLPDVNGEYCGMTFIRPSLAMQSIRRPYGCAVVELGQFPTCSNQILLNTSRHNSQIGFTPHGVFETQTSRYNMNIFAPVNEACFPTLHEVIISSQIKEFYGSGNLTGSHSINHTSNGKHTQGSLGSSGSSNESIVIEMKTFYGDTATILKENNSLLTEVPFTSRLGFPDVVFPDDARNEIYIKFWSGDFSHLNTGAPKMISSIGSGKNIEVVAELRTNTGQVLQRVISRGSGQAKVTRFNSMVYRNNHTPTWGELMKLDVSSEIIEDCHLFFTFRNRQEKPPRQNNGLVQLDRPFAFGYLPLFSSNRTFIPDGEHDLALFKYEKHSAMPEVYTRVSPLLQPGQVVPEITPSLSKFLIPLKDSFIVRSFLCSTRYTQNEVLLKLMKWETLLADPVDLRDTLTKLKFASEVEICKFLRNIFDALFGVLVSQANSETKEYDELVFNALVTLLGIVSDRRFTNFKPVVDLYIDHHFSSTTASVHLLRSFHNLLLNPTSPENAHALRCSIKVWGYLMRFIVRSRELQRLKDLNAPSGGLISDTIESKFKLDLSSALSQINQMMMIESNTIIGTQTLAVQHFSSLIFELSKVFNPLDLLTKANTFCESISATKGKIVLWKLLLQQHIVMSSIFDEPEGRAQLISKLITWVKPHLGQFEDYLIIKPKDSDAVKHSAKVTWLEAARISISVIAVALDRLHEAIIDPLIFHNQITLVQEYDNIEYLLGLLPSILDTFHEFENPTNVEIIQSLGTTASVISPIPIVFPATYPFSLLNSLPTKPNLSSTDSTSSTLQLDSSTQQSNSPTSQNVMGEIAIVMMAMIMLAPERLLKSFLEIMLEVEGKINFASFLSKLFKAFYLILKNKAFPSNWLNVNVISLKSTFKLIQVVSTIMQREFVPDLQQSHQIKNDQVKNEKDGRLQESLEKEEQLEEFDSSLWSDFFVLFHGLLASPHLLIEEFSPQKRRAICKLAGDIRTEGSKIFRASWESIGFSTISIGHSVCQDQDDENALTMLSTKYGGYQVQFVPGFIEPLLELCLSHHDEMRNNAVIVLYSVIVGEYNLNQDFTVIADEVIDKLDNLLGNSPNSAGDGLGSGGVGGLGGSVSHHRIDEMSRASFVGQLRAMVEESSEIDMGLKNQMKEFLEALNKFLELLLSIRNLPSGDEFVDDRVIGTLKLMTFIRNIGRSKIYIHYVHKLVQFHIAHGNHVEAGLAMKLHADLHEWDLNTIEEPIPELSLPRQTSFARKETLYYRILDYFSNGQAWESGIQICKELQEQYENVSFAYQKLSEVLACQSSLYLKIVKTDRYFCEYFRVAFYGQGFPPSVQNRQYVYRGYEWEKLAAFCDRMHNKHPQAQILQTPTVSVEDLQYAEGQYLHIIRVVAEPDRSTEVFRNIEVPSSVRSYYEHNATNTFSYSKPFNKDNVDSNDSVHMWVEKTFLVCEAAFPTVLKRSEVVEIRVLEISPIENAIMSIEQKTKELESLQQRYLALSKTGEAKLNTNPLSMALNNLVDTPANSGIEAYKTAFLTPSYLERHPDQYQSVQILRQAIDHQTLVINKSLRLHEMLCPPEMKAFHLTLHKFFIKNFAEEVARLPLSSSPPNLGQLAIEDESPGLGLVQIINVDDRPMLLRSNLTDISKEHKSAGLSLSLSSQSLRALSPAAEHLNHDAQDSPTLPREIGASPSGPHHFPRGFQASSNSYESGMKSPLSRSLSARQASLTSNFSNIDQRVSLVMNDQKSKFQYQSPINERHELNSLENHQAQELDNKTNKNEPTKTHTNLTKQTNNPAKEPTTNEKLSFSRRFNSKPPLVPSSSTVVDRKSILGLKFGGNRKKALNN
ncbi:hypothetical protein O181_009112 [Austropuccinia psidii MF-1]|uniref:Uncharacterized protein n=1 Tax=Austropuccinia psidii MF-1 TaxID=1389203 RepID=A0A9Q3BR25_9BASI|nr:hypothetical protein [Austropuccinia psidii MF-1]